MSLTGPAPPFSLPDSNGETFTFTPGQSGLPTAVFFYPRAGVASHDHLVSRRTYYDACFVGSIGCTVEVCQFRDAIAGMNPLWGVFSGTLTSLRERYLEE
jgi:peroxiredoxin Q/BCP